MLECMWKSIYVWVGYSIAADCTWIFKIITRCVCGLNCTQCFLTVMLPSLVRNVCRCYARHDLNVLYTILHWQKSSCSNSLITFVDASLFCKSTVTFIQCERSLRLPYIQTQADLNQTQINSYICILIYVNIYYLVQPKVKPLRNMREVLWCNIYVFVIVKVTPCLLPLVT